ncbi:MAG: hypothetical protein II748_07780 [Clostridia bacterium]|nr:hypothetical protein [Clostridia bacterium]
MTNEFYDAKYVSEEAKALFKEERAKKRVDGWFIAREIVCDMQSGLAGLSKEMRAARELEAIIEGLPLTLSDNAIFAGSQSDAFARSYALINPSFKVETFSGYCDPTAVYGDIEPNEEFTKERIERVKTFAKNSEYVKKLTAVYDKYDDYTSEVAFFIEQVTGHIIPDFRPVLKNGLNSIISELDLKIASEDDPIKKDNYASMKITLRAALNLAKRYEKIAREKAQIAEGARKGQLLRLAETLSRVPAEGSRTLFEAIQSYMLLWEVMCMEQAPNPFAFSVGNADRIFEPYRAAEGLSREDASSLFKHFLVFFNVGDRSWAISQNLLISGRDLEGNDLTNKTSYALLDAYYDMNLPQPILSVKLHANTPDSLYEELGRFFFTPGVLTPSFFNDESVFEILRARNVEEKDLPDYAVAGCQEPLIMGKDNGNTTNSWLNLPKILELCLNNGRSLITGKVIEASRPEDTVYLLSHIREIFYRKCEHYVDLMRDAANGASLAVSELPVPFLSVFMGGLESGYDMRDVKNQGTKYNGSGCLIHGLSVVADSFAAIDKLLAERPGDEDELLEALRDDFKGHDDLHAFLKSAPKFGNNILSVDREAAEIASRISDMVSSRKNYLGNPFRADWSSPTTHLTYGYWVGATPDGRPAREQINYGVDPLYGDAAGGMGFRMLSQMRLPFEKMVGGYASHFGIDPKYFTAETYNGKGLDFSRRIIKPLFFNSSMKDRVSPFYLYVNVTTPEMLRKVLADPKKYAPSGVYIMRIHGTFVNFLDLSPAIQQDIIKRLDPCSTAL